jgi:hypothetical protein
MTIYFVDRSGLVQNQGAAQAQSFMVWPRTGAGALQKDLAGHAEIERGVFVGETKS